MTVKHLLRRLVLNRFVLVASLALFVTACDTEVMDAALELNAREAPHEVWLVDQSDTRRASDGRGYGGTLYIYDGSKLAGSGSAIPTYRVDLGDTLEQVCGYSAATPTEVPVRPHMLLFSSGYTHAVLAFVASGHVVVFDAATRTPVSCHRMTATATGRQAHAAFPAPDGSYILVANQNGRLLERIDSDFATNTFVHNAAATLDLANGLTPNGQPRQAPGLRPANAPICPVIHSNSRLAFVTLAGGGLFVVDVKATPMQIVAEYDASLILGNGCGGAEVGGHMYINSGAGMQATNPSRFEVYQFPLHGYTAANAVNTPAPTVVFSDAGHGHERDSHGMVATKGGRYLWVLDRALNLTEVLDARTGAHLNTVSLESGSVPGLTPDLAGISPSGNRIYVSLRGPNPLSGSAHVATGSTPGLAVIQVQESGRRGALKTVVPISNVADGLERADAHGIAVRHK
jgi:DNA-binding beta-propeller fold protein YncE